MGVVGSEGGDGKLAALPDQAGCGLYGLSLSPPHAAAAPRSPTVPSVRSACLAILCMVTSSPPARVRPKTPSHTPRNVAALGRVTREKGARQGKRDPVTQPPTAG